MAIGDSFTEGLEDQAPGGGFRGWADLVAAALAAQRPGLRYANLAIRGKLLAQVVAEQVPRAVELAPDLVSLAAGGNDILRGADVDALAADFGPAVAKLQAAGCRVLIFTGFDPRMFPVIRLLRGRIAAYNMHLRGIADEYGCDLVDLWSMRALKDIRRLEPGPAAPHHPGPPASRPAHLRGPGHPAPRELASAAAPRAAAAAALPLPAAAAPGERRQPPRRSRSRRHCRPPRHCRLPRHCRPPRHCLAAPSSRPVPRGPASPGPASRVPAPSGWPPAARTPAGPASTPARGCAAA